MQEQSYVWQNVAVSKARHSRHGLFQGYVCDVCDRGRCFSKKSCVDNKGSSRTEEEFAISKFLELVCLCFARHELHQKTPHLEAAIACQLWLLHVFHVHSGTSLEWSKNTFELIRDKIRAQIGK